MAFFLSFPTHALCISGGTKCCSPYLRPNTEECFHGLHVTHIAQPPPVCFQWLHMLLCIRWDMLVGLVVSSADFCNREVVHSWSKAQNLHEAMLFNIWEKGSFGVTSLHPVRPGSSPEAWNSAISSLWPCHPLFKHKASALPLWCTQNFCFLADRRDPCQ